MPTFKNIYRRFLAPLTGKYPFFGHWVYFPKNSFIMKILRETGDFEAQTRHLLWQFALDGTYFFDVGANIGILSVPILSLTKDVKVVSFEPSPAVIPSLKKTWEQSPFQSRWTIIEKAVGNFEGMTHFSQHQKAGDDPFDGVQPTHRKGETTTIEVSMTTLDAVWHEKKDPSVSVIKIDVEGFEMSVLAGAKACISACRPVIITEWNRVNLSAYQLSPTVLWDWAIANKYKIFMMPHLYPVQNPQALDVATSLLEYCLLIPNDKPIQRRF
jgi:FkbM family methyltransferase